MKTPKNTVLKITAQNPADGMHASFMTVGSATDICWKVTDSDGSLIISQTEAVSGCEFEISAVFEAEFWSVENPVLYDFCAEINFEDGTTEKINDRFGFRYFECDEKYIYLNGYPFYMRAYIRGCAAHEHENNCRLEEKEFYRKNITMAKQYGFNTIRFHSVIPPRECFEVADELGILIHIETRADNQDYDNLEEMLYGKNNFVTNGEIEEIVNSLYNHPSFMVYCVGNEIRTPGKNPRIKEIHDYIKKLDPTRLFIDTCAHGEFDRQYVDFDVQHMGYFFPYGKNKNMFSDTDNLLGFGTVKDRAMVKAVNGGKIRRGIRFNRPLIAHEVCHYTSWRDFYALKDKFSKYGVEAPWWIDEEIKMIEAKGYKDNFDKLLQITKDYQFRCWKTAFEGIRSSTLLSGFHMLQFADTDRYENSNGVVDCFDDYQGISAESFRDFNADTVIVARLPKQVMVAGESLKIPVILSQFAINPPRTGEFSYKLSADGIDYSSGILENVDTGESGVYEICSIECDMPELTSPKKLILTAKLGFDDSSECSNSWEVWVFPKISGNVTVDGISVMDGDYLNTKVSFSGKNDFVVTDKLDDSLFEMLDEGKDVMLIYRTDWTRHLLHKDMVAPKYSLRHTWDRFKGVIWDRGTINGGYDDSELLNKYGFCTDGQLNFQYYSLVDDCDKINLDDFPVEVKSIVSGLDKSSRDRFDPSHFGERELMYDRTMRHFSYVFELKVGRGRLLVTGFNFTGIADGDVAALNMFKTLTAYCRSGDFDPVAYMSVDEIKSYLAYVAAEGPQKERMMTQYWQLDAEPVESMDYWTESERYLKDTIH